MLMLPSRAALEVNRVYHSDALLLCSALEAQSVDMILCDLPYGTTACSWDTVIPFDAMWQAFKRVIKPHGAIVLTATQPFTSMLIMSNLAMFRYEWIWEKTQGGGFLNANRQPLKRHENILVFYQREPDYFPQMTEGKPYVTSRGAAAVQVNNGGKQNIEGFVTVNSGQRYPKTILHFDSETGLHPTQKPVNLFSYLIETYTQAGDVVLDPTCGSGTTAIAARNTGRNFICGDSSAEYVEVARKRLAQPFTLPMLLETAS